MYQGALISVTRDSIEGPGGEWFDRDVVHHPGAVSVVPVVGTNDAVLLVRQYRAAVDQELLELVAGKRDVAGEPPEETARRELAEEIGMRPGRLELLARFYNSPGFCDELSFVFLGLDLEAVPASAQGIEEQHMTIHRVALSAVPAMIARGEIIDAKTIIGLTLAMHALS
jgi:8-oxo-dGTP pyrophosphatase MutT (NUDIX family)